MKRILACISLVAVTTTAAVSAQTPPAKSASVHKTVAPTHVALMHVAPADEYFGKLKMSVLGIRNTIKDVGANIDIDPTRWTQLASKAAFAEDAMRDWEKKYPEDTWLAKMVFSLERMYAKLDNDEGRQRSIVAMKWLVHDFPRSWYGKTGKKELAMGRVGKPTETAAAAPAASPSPSPDLIAAPTAVSSDAPSLPTNGAGMVSPDQASSGVVPTPAANPVPATSPAAPQI